MSLRYTTTRLWFAGNHGQAQSDGFERNLLIAPKLKVLDVPPAEIDYCPELRTWEIRPHSWDRRREMEPPEMEAVKAWLARFVEVMARRMESICRRAL